MTSSLFYTISCCRNILDIQEHSPLEEGQLGFILEVAGYHGVFWKWQERAEYINTNKITSNLIRCNIHLVQKNVSLFQCLLFPSRKYYAPDFFSVGPYMCVEIFVLFSA